MPNGKAAQAIAKEWLDESITVDGKKYTVGELLKEFHTKIVREYTNFFSFQSYEQQVSQQIASIQHILAHPEAAAPDIERKLPEIRLLRDGSIPADQETLEKIVRKRLHQLVGDPANHQYLLDLVDTLGKDLLQKDKINTGLLQQTDKLETLLKRQKTETGSWNDAVYNSDTEDDRRKFEEFVGEPIAPIVAANIDHFIREGMLPLQQRKEAYVTALEKLLHTVQKINHTLGLGTDPDGRDASVTP